MATQEEIITKFKDLFGEANVIPEWDVAKDKDYSLTFKIEQQSRK
jgi:hypothetical protein